MSKISVDTLKNSKPITDIKEIGITDESVAQLYLLLTDDTYKVSAEKNYFFNKSSKVYELVDNRDITKNIKNTFRVNDGILKEVLVFKESKTNNQKKDREGKTTTEIITTKTTDYYKKLMQNIKTKSKIDKYTDAVIQELYEDDKYKLKKGINENIQDVILFKNGILDLKTFELRERTENDYYDSSVVLSYDFETLDNPEVKKEYDKMKEMLMHTFNDDEETFEYVINCFAGGLTRRKNDHYFFNFTGNGGNGKTFIFNLAKAVFEGIYVDKLNNKIIYAKSTNTHKSKNDLMKPALGIGYFDEVDTKLIDINGLKDLTGGEEIKNEQLYKNEDASIKLKTQLYLITNYILNFVTKDYEAITRRGREVNFKNVFYNTEEEIKNVEGVNYYKQDKNYLNDIPDARKQAFIHILKEGFKNYYSNGSIKDNLKFAKAFEKLCERNDYFKSFIDARYEITGNSTGRSADSISFMSMRDEYISYYKKDNRYSMEDFKDDIKKFKRQYFSNNDTVRIDEKSRKDEKLGNRGAVYGLKLKDDIDIFDSDNNDYEELEKDYEDLKHKYDFLTEDIKKYKAEIEDLKKKLKEYEALDYCNPGLGSDSIKDKKN